MQWLPHVGRVNHQPVQGLLKDSVEQLQELVGTSGKLRRDGHVVNRKRVERLGACTASSGTGRGGAGR